MKQEYLFNNPNELETIKTKQFDNVNLSFYELPTKNNWIIIYETSTNNENDAKKLSLINSYIHENFSCYTLTNESSSYFNKVLFPQINLFERNLRKLLYVSSALHEDKSLSQNITRLEEKDLGALFELLFTDPNYIANARKEINSKTWKFTKTELVSSFSSLPENTLWDKLLTDTSVPTLRNNFTTIKNYRNDVMHAHNMDFDSFKDAKKYFENVNNELTIELNKLLGNTHQKADNFNETLDIALKKFNSATDIENMGNILRSLGTQIDLNTPPSDEGLKTALYSLLSHLHSIH